jgi:hypothetical protein
VALARRGPQYETDEPLDVRVVLVGFRGEVGLDLRGAAALRGLYRHALAGLSFGTVIAELDAGGQWQSGWSYEVALGAGLSLLGLFDVLALGGYRHADSASGAQAGGPILRGRLRLTTNLFGLGVLGEVLPERSWLVTFDLVPLGILGSLL